MKKILFLLSISLLLLAPLYSQSTERFIRIIGNSEYTFNSNLTRVYFTVNEIAPNEYKKISYKPIETSYSEFVEKMKELGFVESQIIQTNSEINKYSKTKTKYYYIDVNKQDQLDGLAGLQDQGFKVKEVKYLYTNIEQDIEAELSLKAIKDAKRKAQNICDELDMSLGKILNIEDKSSGCCASIEESKNPVTVRKYNITITFELLDK